MTPSAAPPDDDAGANDDIPAALQLDLPSYSGPIDLLVDLIREQEIDVFDIPIALITRQYLAYVEQMKQLDLQVGGEWLEMAATLVHIKSKLLLPDDPDEDEEEGPDPRDELVRRLVEHEMFQWAAEQLDERPQLDRDFKLAAPKARDERRETGPPELRQASLFDLVDALKRVIDEQDEDDAEWVHEITQQKLTLRGVILDISSMLDDSPRIRFAQLFAGKNLTRHRVVTTFLALLEMTRLDMIRLFQPRLEDQGRDELVIERAVIDIVDVSETLDLPDGSL